jgi:hypothetical protein
LGAFIFSFTENRFQDYWPVSKTNKGGSMKPNRFILIGMFVLCFSPISGSFSYGGSLAPVEPGVGPSAGTAARFTDLPLYFIANKGQLDPQVYFTLPGADKTLFFTAGGVTLLLTGRRSASSGRIKTASLEEGQEQPRQWAARLSFVGGDAGVIPRGRRGIPAVFSYFRGTPDQWRAAVPTFSELVYEGLWPGVDLVFSGDAGRVKYAFIVQPGADPNRIRLAYEGATVELVSGGGLQVDTPAGGFTDPSPLAWQGEGTSRTVVLCAYELGKEQQDGSRSYGFRLGPYDPSRPLVLDPEFIVYSGLLGGSGDEEGRGIVVDGLGQAYVTGYTASAEFPRTVGLPHAGGMDVFVAKVKAEGSGLAYSVLLGGSSYEVGTEIAVDGLGQAYVTGYTASAEFPRTVGLPPAGGSDVFVAKVKADGSDLVYSRLLGGSGTDHGWGIAVDGIGQAYVTGDTPSADFPRTMGLPPAGGYDVFVAKVKADGSDLVYSRLLGGRGTDHGYGIAVDGVGQAYVTGETASADFPRTVGLPPAGGYDVFVAKVKADGSDLVYSGLLGGSGDEAGRGIVVDGLGQAYVTGYTASADFPRTVGLPHAGGYDVFVAKVKADGSGLAYSGLLGGSGDERGNGIAVDGLGQAYVTGYTASADFPRTVGLPHAGGYDVFVAKVKADGSDLAYSGLLGGSSWDVGNGIAVDGLGQAYVTGSTASADFPRTVGLPPAGGRDIFGAKVWPNWGIYCPIILK